MPRHSFRLLGGTTTAAATSSAPSSPVLNSDSTEPAAVDSDFVVILAALLCALICVLGLVAVARCAWLRRLSGGGNIANRAASSPPPPANKGLKKKILRSLPKHTFTPEASAKLSDCAICLAEFAAGDEIRELPQCGHGFHVACIDTWLGSHSSCPSCRQILVVARCQKCGSLPGSSSGGEADQSEARSKEREDDVNRFLP